MILIIYFLSTILLVNIPWAEKVAVQFSDSEFYPKFGFCSVHPLSFCPTWSTQ